jgi:hypothetical protein
MLFRKKTRYEKARAQLMAFAKKSMAGLDKKQVAVYSGLALITLVALRGRLSR